MDEGKKGVSKDKKADLLFPEQINIVSGYKGSKIKFYLRMLTVSEENQYMQRFVDLPEDPKARDEAEYNVLVEGLKEWSVKAPTVILTDDKGNSKERPLYSENIAETFDKVFGSYTPANERVLNSVVFNFRSAMSPDTSFF